MPHISELHFESGPVTVDLEMEGTVSTASVIEAFKAMDVQILEMNKRLPLQTIEFGKSGAVYRYSIW